jgi:transcription-repair coupling factor (superfamily II helicase)
MYEKADVHVERIPILLDKYKGDLKFTIDTNPYFSYQKKGKNKKEKDEDILELVKKILIDIKTLID